MKYLKITNKGEIDWRLISLLGGTTKRGDESKIGRFGSGLKYVVAYLCRENLDFKIYSGKKLLKVKTETEEIRGERFEIICIDGHRTSITTKMGPDFQPWQVIREVYANSLDEGESSYCVKSTVGGTEGYTSFYIQINDKIQDVLDNWDKYFIYGKEPMFQNRHIKVYSGTGNLKLYKNGILIHEDPAGKRSLFNYDYLHASINELREHTGSVNHSIYECLSQLDAKTATYFLENITDDHFEASSSMDYNWFSNFGEGWKEAIGTAKLITEKIKGNLRARGTEIDDANYITVPEKVYAHLTKQFEGVGALKAVQKGYEFMESYNPITENRMKQALTILEHCNYTIHPRMTFKFGYFEDKRIFGLIDRDEECCYLSNTLCNLTIFQMVATIIEENEHLLTGMADNSREFQQHFIDLYTKSLLKEQEIEV